MHLSLLALAIFPSVLAFADYGTQTHKSRQDCPFAKRRLEEEEKYHASFDPSQLIDVTGRHAYQAPKKGDLRGPCPALNSLANHGYLARSGFTTLTEAMYATNTVFNLGLDVSTVLSALSVVLSGNPLDLSWSIGGPPPLNLLSGLLGRPQGLSGSHNKYESDSSPGRGDAYTHNGDAITLDLETFMHMYNLTDPVTGNYDIEVIKKQRVYTFGKSVHTNPYFFYGPFAGLIATQAAHSFIPRLMSNNSEKGAILDGKVLRSFFGVSDRLEVHRGTERIPDNWYRRSTPYSFKELNDDTVDFFLEFPQLLAIGGNTGKVNTFTGIDVVHFTKGAYDIKTLFQGNNLLCFAYQAIQNVTPDVTNGLLGHIPSVIARYITPLFASLACPQLEAFNNDVFAIYPGAKGTF